MSVRRGEMSVRRGEMISGPCDQKDSADPLHDGQYWFKSLFRSATWLGSKGSEPQFSAHCGQSPKEE